MQGEAGIQPIKLLTMSLHSRKQCLSWNVFHFKINRRKVLLTATDGQWDVSKSCCRGRGSWENSLGQWSPSFLAPGTGFLEDNFFIGQGGGMGDLGWFRHVIFIVHLSLLFLLHQLHLWSSDIRFWRLGTLVLEDQDTVGEAGGFLSSPLISPVNEGRQHLNS